MTRHRRHPSIPATLLGPRHTVRDLVLRSLPGVAIVVGLIALAVGATADSAPTTERLELLASAGLLAALAVSYVVHRAPAQLVGLVALMIGLFAASKGFGNDDRSLRTGVAGDGVAEVLVLLASLALVGALMEMIRLRRGRGMRSIVADTSTVALGGWLATWVVVIHPTLRRSDAADWILIVRGLSHSLSVPIAFLLVLLVFSGVRQVAAVWCIVVGGIAAMAADLLSALTEAGHVHVSEARTDTLFVVGLCFAAAGIVHASIGTLADPVPQHRSHSQTTRILLTIACLPAPALLLALTDPATTADRAVRTVSIIALTFGITLRVADAIHSNNVAHLKLLRHAQRDVLTGLPNRTLLNGRIAEALTAAEHTGTRPALLFIGLDRFKNVNDSLGHDVGDEVLRLVARRLVTAAPPHAHVGRIAGDEFVVLDPTIRSIHEANSLADRLLSLFREPLHVGAGDMYVMASIGVAVANPVSSNPQELQRNADTAMCRAKESGGNSFQLFDDAMYERVFHRLEIESGLHRALERRELQLYYQPIVDLVSGEVNGFEALMRWQMADGRLVSPAEFIPVAEDTGLIVGIGNWALLEALTQLRTWIDEGVCSRSATMSVNVSPRQLRDPSLISAVNEALRRSGVAPRNVWLEVTESVMISEPDQALAALRRLQQLNVRLAIDDFGTGYSSLSLLRKFPLQRIKIDRSFISGMTDDENAHSLVRTIVAMASSLNLDLVAEGLESRDQLRALTALGCRKAQGFLLSSPVTAAAMRATVLSLETAGLWTGGLQLSWPEE